jgi:ADP-heptose:LPS heptosyltransferase
VEKILLIRLKAIGDVILTLPAVHAVRKNFPSAQITFLTSKENLPLLRGFRDVDEAIALDRAALRGGHPLKMSGELFGLLEKMRAGKFSLAVDFQGFGETAWLARLTGAARRWGSVHGRGRAWAYTRWFPRNDEIHPADWNLSLLRQCGLKLGEIQNEFSLPPDALAAAKQFLATQNISATEKFLFIQPFTSSPHKNWPLENYLAVARHWRDGGGQVIFGGGPADAVALEPARVENFCVAAGQPLLVSGALAKLSALMLAGDTGLAHLAVAAGQRVVMLMGHDKPGRPCPWRHPDWAILPPVDQNIATIPVAQVSAACAAARQ